MKIAMMIRMISMWKPLYIICFDRPTLNVSKVFWQGAFLLFFFVFANVQYVYATDWSNTSPKLNLSHVFEGEINKRGKPVGYHARFQGQDPERAMVLKIISGPNQAGVYTGSVEILDVQKNRWKRKSFSSFFPDNLSRIDVQTLILKAYGLSKVGQRGKWRGMSALGFSIEGWLCPKGGRPSCPEGAINTAYPIYKKD